MSLGSSVVGWFAVVILIVVALALLVALEPMIHAVQEAVSIAEFEEAGRHAELSNFLRAELHNIRLADPYNARWWGKWLNGREYNNLENALDGFLTDTEFDGLAEYLLYQALENAGVHVTNLGDAVHAANHLINGGKVKGGEPLPKQIEEDNSGNE